MKTHLLLTILLIFIMQALLAQVDQTPVKGYTTWVLPIKRGPATKGLLYEVRDSSILVSHSSLKADYLSGKPATMEFWSKDIKAIHLRKKGAQGTAILTGGITGAVVGLLVGVATQNHGGPDDLEKEYNKGSMIVFPLLFTGIGVGMGGMFGGIKKQLPVRGSQSQFNLIKRDLEDRSIKYALSGKLISEIAFSTLRDSAADADGNVYHLLALGGQVWMAGDLKSTHFADGSEIPGVQTDAAGNKTLYSWQVVRDPRKVCPAGFHVPSQTEWISLFNSLGGENYTAVKMQEGFQMNGQTGLWWSSTEYDPGKGQSFYVDTQTHASLLRSSPKTSALQVRCIRDH